MQELVQVGLTGQKKEGCSNCEERLQVNLSVGLLVVLGERKEAVRKQFKDDIPDCVLKTSCPTQFPLESQVKNCPQLMDCVMGKHYKTTELTEKKGHLGSSFHILGFIHCHVGE